MNPMEIDHKVLTVKEICDLLQVHQSTVYKLVRQGKIPSFRVGSDWRFHRDVIVRWMVEKSTAARQVRKQPATEGRWQYVPLPSRAVTTTAPLRRLANTLLYRSPQFRFVPELNRKPRLPLAFLVERPERRTLGSAGSGTQPRIAGQLAISAKGAG